MHVRKAAPCPERRTHGHATHDRPNQRGQPSGTLHSEPAAGARPRGGFSRCLPALHKLQLDGRQVRRRLLRGKERGELEPEDVCASLRNKRAGPENHQPIVALCVDFDKECRATLPMTPSSVSKGTVTCFGVRSRIFFC